MPPFLRTWDGLHIDIHPYANPWISDKKTATTVCQTVDRFRRKRVRLPLVSHRLAGCFAELERPACANSDRRVKGYGYQRIGFSHVPNSRPFRLNILPIHATSVHIRNIKISLCNYYIIQFFAIRLFSMFRQIFPRKSCPPFDRSTRLRLRILYSYSWLDRYL